MADAREYLLTVDHDAVAATEIAKRTAYELELKKVTLSDVVTSLRDFVTDEDAAIRSKAHNYLSQVIAALPSDFLTRQEVAVLCEFLCDRIEDGGSIPGLITLQGLQRFNAEMATVTIRAVLSNLQDLQTRPQSQRFMILQLLHGLMRNHRRALKRLGSESLMGIVDLVAGERDPRNLMIIFSLLRVLIVEWDIRSHAESLFDAAFCYFPITFRPPPNDPFKISSQDLKIRLRDCISASSSFAPYAFPQLLDKLDSTSANIKASPSPSNITTMSDYAVTIWNSLKYEIFNAQEEDVADEAMEALQSIAIRLAAGSSRTDGGSPLAYFLKPLIKDCDERLREPENKQAKPAGRILSGLTGTSTALCFLIVKAVFPPMFTIYQDSHSIDKRRAILEPISSLLKSSQTYYGLESNATDTTIANPIRPFKDQLFELSRQALMSSPPQEISFRLVALECLKLMASLRDLLEANEVGLIVLHLDDIVLEWIDDNNKALRDAAIVGLLEISKYRPALIQDITFPAFMAKLPDPKEPKSKDYSNALEGLARISAVKHTSDALARRLFSRLDDLLSNNGSKSYCRAILSTLQYTLDKRTGSGTKDMSDQYERLVPLLKRAALSSLSSEEGTALNDPDTLTALGKLACTILHGVNLERHQTIAHHVYDIFCGVPIFISTEPKSSLSHKRRLTVILSTYLLAGIDKKVQTPHLKDHPEMLLGSLTKLILSEHSGTVRHGLLQHLSVLINKFLPAEKLDIVKPILWGPQIGLLNGSNLSENAVRAVFWISKSLLLRSYEQEAIVTRLVELLAHSKLCSEAARGCELLFAPDSFLSKENGANIRLLARQKAFCIFVPLLASELRKAAPETKSNYLIALSGVLKHIEMDIFMPEVQTILPILLQCLDLSDQEAKASTIGTLAVISQETPVALEEHISGLVNRLIKVATDSTANDVKGRYNALRCLRLFPGKIKDSTLLPYRSTVVRSTVAALDDPKRHVRKEAVDCRTRWLDMDEPDVDE